MGYLVTDDILEFACEFRLDKHIARIEEPFLTLALSADYLIYLLAWNKNLGDQILQAASFYLLLKILLGFLFLSTCCTQDIPFLVAFAHDNR